MNDMDQDERDRLTRHIAWLASADRDDWHRVALDFNWSRPLYVLDWIVRQADCDVATALTIFWQGQPSAWLEEAGPSAEEPDGYSYLNRQFCVHIAQRVGEGGYTRSKIAYAPDTWTKSDYVDLAEEVKRLENPNIRAHRGLIRGRWGRRVENDSAFYARYPAEFHDTVLCELPGDTPRSIAIMESVRLVEQATLRRLPSWLRS